MSDVAEALRWANVQAGQEPHSNHARVLLDLHARVQQLEAERKELRDSYQELTWEIDAARQDNKTTAIVKDQGSDGTLAAHGSKSPIEGCDCVSCTTARLEAQLNEAVALLDAAREIRARLNAQLQLVWQERDQVKAEAAVLYKALVDTLDFASWMTGHDYWEHNKHFKKTWPAIHTHASITLNSSITAAAFLAEHERLKELVHKNKKEQDEIEQLLAKAMDYPWFKDDQKNFPGANENNGVCIGDHVAVTLAMEAARTIERLKANQRTPGTREVCENYLDVDCQDHEHFGSHRYDICGPHVCPIRAVKESEG